jgi:Na+/melibiose symporter-like transporter
MALVGDVLDHLEWRFHYRYDGLTISVTTIFTLIMPIIGNATVNKLLAIYNYVSPLSGAVTQSVALQSVFDFLAVGAEVVSSIIIVVLMLLFTVEKNIQKEQQEIQEVRKAAVIAAGGVYVSPEEKERLDAEEFEKEQQSILAEKAKGRKQK